MRKWLEKRAQERHYNKVRDVVEQSIFEKAGELCDLEYEVNPDIRATFDQLPSDLDRKLFLIFSVLDSRLDFLKEYQQEGIDKD